LGDLSAERRELGHGDRDERGGDDPGHDPEIGAPAADLDARTASRREPALGRCVEHDPALAGLEREGAVALDQVERHSPRRAPDVLVLAALSFAEDEVGEWHEALSPRGRVEGDERGGDDERARTAHTHERQALRADELEALDGAGGFGGVHAGAQDGAHGRRAAARQGEGAAPDEVIGRGSRGLKR